MFDGLFRVLTGQKTPRLRSEGQRDELQGTRLGQLFTAGWKERLLLAGVCYSVTVGDGANGGGAPAGITGGGNGTTIDSDQPELAVGCKEGYFHIPLRCRFGGKVDLDADAEIGEWSLFADLTRTVTTTDIAQGTAKTPTNMLGGGPDATGLVVSAVTGDITDPVCSMQLDYKVIRAAEFVCNGSATNLTNGIVTKMEADFQPIAPQLLKGPCMVVACFGGTAAVTGLIIYEYAEVPADWFKV